MKRVVSAMLSVVILLSMCCIGSISASAASQRSTLVQVAEAEVGVSGRPNKYTRWLGTIEGSYSYEWCATFVSWCGYTAGLSGMIPKNAGCDYGMNWFKDRGQWQYSRAFGGAYTPRPGDIIYFSNNGNQADSTHVGIVKSASGNTVTTIEGNYDDRVAIVTRDQSSTYVLGFGIPAYEEDKSTILGNYEECSGGQGTVTVKGWAFDNANPSVSTEVHVYIGGPAGEGEGKALVANVSRPDVHKVYGCGDKHGFQSTISTTKRGSQPVYVYAISADKKTNVLLGSKTVNISEITDTTKPVVSNVKVSKTDAKSFTISCTVKDNALNKVHMYAWYTSDKNGTQKSYNANISGTTVSCTIPIADLGGKNGKYTVHIYAYDKKENCGTGAISLDFYNPTGTLDSAAGDIDSVVLRGWAFDGNDTSKPVEMNVYIGGDAGTGEGHAFLANTSRPDVNKVHGCGDNHGFSVKLSTKKTGTQDVYVYMQNIGNGGVKLLQKTTVTILKDTARPNIKNSKITTTDGTTFKVTADVSDNVAVTKGTCIAWLDGDKENTMKTYTATINNGKLSCTFNRKDISDKQGTYVVDIYAYDAANNRIISQRKYNYYVPKGAVEVIKGADNSIKVKGWVFDKSSIDKSVDVVVTLSSGGISETFTITADTYRTDIQNMYNCGEYHGFEATLETNLVGKTTVTVSAKDVETGILTELKTDTVTITDANKIIPGNVNNDESLDVNDVTYVQMYLAGYSNADGSIMIDTSKAEVFKAADANGDGSLDINDATYIQMVIAGIIK